jgi:hypothetical protein
VYAGRLLPCIGRAVLFSAIYTGFVVLLCATGWKLFHMFAPPLPH